MSTPYQTKTINRDSSDEREVELIAKLDAARADWNKARLAYITARVGTPENTRLGRDYREAAKRLEAAANNLLDHTGAAA
jgi:hypothetical protein